MGAFAFVMSGVRTFLQGMGGPLRAPRQRANRGAPARAFARAAISGDQLRRVGLLLDDRRARALRRFREVLQTRGRPALLRELQRPRRPARSREASADRSRSEPRV